MKVIASSLRKGNVVEMDGKLYAVLKAENFHPGKGTPTTSVDMRRISDGVKVAERFKSDVSLERDGTRANGKSIIALVTLAASLGTSVKIGAEGPDA